MEKKNGPKIGHNKKDPDQRDYSVSSKKLESNGLYLKSHIENDIKQTLKLLSNI